MLETNESVRPVHPLNISCIPLLPIAVTFIVNLLVLSAVQPLNIAPHPTLPIVEIVNCGVAERLVQLANMAEHAELDVGKVVFITGGLTNFEQSANIFAKQPAAYVVAAVSAGAAVRFVQL